MDDKFYAVPYIGVSDVGSYGNIAELRQHFCSFEPLRLKASIMMTRKALWGIPTKWKDVCPSREDIQKIFADEPAGVLQVIQYADDDGVDLSPSLELLTELGGRHLRAIQLDMTWPDPRILEEFKKAHPSIQLILKVGEKAFEEIDNNPLKMWEAVKNYDGLVNRILLDRGIANGKELEARSLVRFVDILYERMIEPGVVVAGGLGPKTLHLVEPLMAMYPRLSIDAKGRLRESGRALDGPIAMPLAMIYTSLAVSMHRKYNVMS